MNARQRRLERMRSIMREYRIAEVATEDLQVRFQSDPFALTDRQLKAADFQNFRDNLEATYLLRLFAEFEAGLREAWESAFGQVTIPRARDLIDSIAARRMIADPWRFAVHDVRTCRNALVHEGSHPSLSIGMGEALSRLCRFFSAMPLDW